MKRKNYRLGIAALMGLACYFLALSALLFGSMGMPGGNGFGAGAGETSHSRGNSPKPPQPNLHSHGKSHAHGSGLAVAGTTTNEDGRCTSAPAACGGTNFAQAVDETEGLNGPGPSEPIVNTGTSDASGGHDSIYPAPSDFAFFAANIPSAGTGENGGGGNPSGKGDLTDGPGPAGDRPGQPNTSPPIQPGLTDPPISQFFLNDPPGPGNPDTPTGAPQIAPSDPPPPSDPPGPLIPVPEPATFWTLVGGVAIAVKAHRGSGRAKLGQPRR